MNRYPAWVYATVAVALLLGALYTLPNFFGEVPAVQVSPLKTTAKIDTSVMQAVEQALKSASITSDGIFTDPNSIKVRFRDTDTQLKAKDVLDRALNPVADNPSFILALNLISDSPSWFTAINALPMYLGLDLREALRRDEVRVRRDRPIRFGCLPDETASDAMGCCRFGDPLHRAR